MIVNFTTVLPVYVAVLCSTVAIVVSVAKYIKDRAHVVVEAGDHVLMSSRAATHKLGIKVINKGRRPVTIEGCGFKVDTDSGEILLSVLDPNLPKPLGEGESLTTYADPSEVQAKNVLFAWARDAGGRVYKSKGRPFRR
jgi:hypothetical protein